MPPGIRVTYYMLGICPSIEIPSAPILPSPKCYISLSLEVEHILASSVQRPWLSQRCGAPPSMRWFALSAEAAIGRAGWGNGGYSSPTW
eukprot:CAMPEP_0174384546 /NCGR_PEP_ID=MMETSP0811_2-20130205/125991_1 /TAXON_ID=73025 ORGANISM="Eutreptiella gymnastica-like, Strain CCMP1594" /NCGR_SAMPLE_ID=MMETSP0811_2 /ASSEMBLY_ACC=CAM_ASM_000667 /LENGTH=88 /DNA_ID=CAMNT_0015538545 /DNA_START=1707 /DNA_END=1970 /DNA_ORIENTATION=-